MKKFSFFKIASLALVCVMLLGAFMFTTFAADESAEETVEIVSQNVYFDDKLELMFAVNAPAGHSVTATVNGQSVGVELYEENPTRDNGEIVAGYAYKLVQGVVPQAIDTVVTFTVTYGETTVSKDYSVLQYIYERMYVSASKAEGTELAMLKALLAYADAANAHLNGATVSFSDYKYVTVVDGTLDGYNTTGMFAPDATPFGNIETTLDYDNSTHNVEWSVSVDGGEAVNYDNDKIKNLTVTGNMTVTAVLVESECIHDWSDATCTTLSTCSKCGETTGELAEHTWVDATCEAPKTCSACGATEGDVGSHADNNGDLACDTCGKVLAEKLTLSFATTESRTEFTTSKQVWAANGIVFTNDKASSTNNVADYSDPVRCYKGSTITIECTGMSKIVINCNSSSYAGITATTSGTLSVSGDTVTITFDNNVDSVILTCGGGQVRIDSIDVFAVVCEHTNTEEVAEVPSTCTKAGSTAGTKCADCGKILSGVVEIPKADHTWVDATCSAPKTCSVCNATEGDVLAHNYVDGVCTVCGNEEPSQGGDEPAEPTTVTISKSHTDIATIAGVTAGQSSGNIGDKKISLDENISITCAKGTSTSVPCIYSESIRLYQNGATMTISAENNAQMKTIVITLATKSGGQGPISVTGGTASELSNNKYTITVNEGVTSVVITTTGTSSSARLYVANIEVVYEK